MHFFFSSRRRHTRWPRDWSSDVCSSDLAPADEEVAATSTVTQEATANETTTAPSNTDGTDDNAGGESEIAEDSASNSTGIPAEDDQNTSLEPEHPDQAELTPEDFQALMAEEMRNNGNVGDTFTIDGQPTELCK